MSNSITHPDMYVFGSIVKEALDKVAVPLVKKSLQQAMSSQMSPGEIYDYAESIMKNYEYYKEDMIKRNDPVGGFSDFTALWFLLFPYQKKNDDDSAHEDMKGAGDRYLLPYYTMDSRQRFYLTYLRRIRNVATHNEGKKKLVEKNPELETEKGALDFIEKALKPLDANVGEILRDYRTELDEKIQRELNRAGADAVYDNIKQKHLNMYVNKIEQDRREYAFRKTKEYPYMAAPIGKAMEGTAPWADNVAFVNDLEWPSKYVNYQYNQQNPGNQNGFFKFFR